MAEMKKPGPLPIPQFGGAVAKPLTPAAPPIETEKRLLQKPIKRKHAFHKGTTAYSGNKSKTAFPG